MKYGHWNYSGNIKVDDYAGFVYCITNSRTLRRYIGCKVFRFKRGKNFRPSGWETYTGSNIELNEDIRRLGIDAFTFDIIKVCKTKTEMKYEEAKHIIVQDAIYRPEFYNQLLYLRLRNNAKRFSRPTVARVIQGKT